MSIALSKFKFMNIKRTFLPLLVGTFSLIIVHFCAAQGVDQPYTLGSTKLKGYFAKAKGSKKNAPGVLVISAWMGINDHSKGYANKLSELGYDALVADIYGDGNNPKNKQEAGKLAGQYKNDYKSYQDRIKAGLDELIKLGADPKKIAVIGFCFGGTGALEAARAGLPVAGVVSFHGGLSKDTTRPTLPIQAKVLVLHGADDPYVKPVEVSTFIQEMNTAKADWQLIEYANAVHAFTDLDAGNDNSKGAAYNERATKRANEHMKLFLKELFRE